MCFAPLQHGKDVKHVLFFFGFKPRLMVFAADTAQDILVRNNKCFQKVHSAWGKGKD